MKFPTRTNKIFYYYADMANVDNMIKLEIVVENWDLIINLKQ